jgi:hypothetical protein
VEKQVKERSSEADNLSTVIERLKQRQEEMVEEIEAEHRKK